MNDGVFIFLIRHGRTEWNKKKIFRGHMDIPLDEVGIQQAEKAGKYLQEVAFTTIYSSTLRRAFQTAQIISRYQSKSVEVIPCQGFSDLNYGEWEGKSYERVKEEYPALYKMWEEEPHKVKIPGGETLSEAAERSFKALEEIILKHKGHFIGIVSHRVIIKLVILKMLGIGESGFWMIRQDPCCINIVRFYGYKFSILRVNDTSHIFTLKENLGISDF